MDYKLIGEIIGVVAMVESFFIYLSNRRKHIILLKGISDVIWAVSQAFIGAYTGAVLNVVMIFREFVFYNRMDKKWAQHKMWMYFFMLMCMVSPLIETVKTGTFNIVPFLPALGSVVAVLGFYDTNPKRIRILNFLATLPWLAYAIFLHNYSSILSNIISLSSILLGSLLAKHVKR